MNQQQLIVRWVKASERLPQNNGEYLCRYVHPEASCYRGAAYLLYSDGQFYAEDEMANLEWLEEGGMQGEGERLRECSNARKNEIIRLRELNDELAEELEKKTESASMWAKKAMEAGLERNQLAAEVERLKGEREALIDLLGEAYLQLDYLDGRFPTGTTPAVLTRIKPFLKPNTVYNGKEL